MRVRIAVSTVSVKYGDFELSSVSLESNENTFKNFDNLDSKAVTV